MKLSLNSAAVRRIPGSLETKGLKETTVIIGKAGFDCVDLDFTDIHSKSFILRGEHWQREIEELGRTAREMGMSFYQSHAPFPNGATLTSDAKLATPEKMEYFEEMHRRAMIASAMLGVEWVVIHPLTMPECGYERVATLAANHRYFDRFVELGIQNGVGTTFENMLPSLDRKCPMRYCQHYEELIEFVDSYHDPKVGICWDSGHANQAGLDQGRALHAIGHRLKTLHINDNIYGNLDEHLLPFMGTVDWNAVIGALADIDYQGTLNYETPKATSMASGAIQENLLGLCHANARYLRELLLQARRERQKMAI